MPLRIRLVIILVLLVAVALAVIEPITYTTTRNALVAKVNAQLTGSVSALSQYFRGIGGGDVAGLQVGMYAALYTANGDLVKAPAPAVFTDCTAQRCPPLPTPNVSPAFVRRAASSPNGQLFTTAQGSGGVAFEVLGNDIHLFGVGPGAVTLVVALPLTGVNATMGHILVLELVIGGCVLAALAAVSWFLVRLGLRPLEQMAATASEIAAGDLTKRVEVSDERTEVGQLGAALNVMLTQIEKAFREREASEERLRRFVGDASHELRTPLTSIRGYAELFKDGGSGSPQDLSVALGRIESESARMGGLVDDLLLLARLDQGRPLDHERVDLAVLAADAVRDANVVDASRSVHVVSSGPCVVLGDEQRLRQVLGNLIGNALTYSPAGSPIEVEVRLEWPAVDVSGLPGFQPVPTVGKFGRLRQQRGGAAEASSWSGRPLGPADLVVTEAPPPGNGASPAPAPEPSPTAEAPADSPGAARVAVAVVDHGPGIAPEDVPHVFERFWRADQSRHRASGGTGLGLSIVAAVVTSHGGQVGIRPTPGGGATFVVELPAAPPSEGFRRSVG